MNCCLCLKRKSLDIDIFGETGQRRNMAEIIAKHFWFKPQPANKRTNFICVSCWSKLHDFHKFYVSVLEVHRSYEKNVKSIPTEPDIKTTIYEQHISNENITVPVINANTNVASESALNVSDACAKNTAGVAENLHLNQKVYGTCEMRSMEKMQSKQEHSAACMRSFRATRKLKASQTENMPAMEASKRKYAKFSKDFKDQDEDTLEEQQLLAVEYCEANLAASEELMEAQADAEQTVVAENSLKCWPEMLEGATEPKLNSTSWSQKSFPKISTDGMSSASINPQDDPLDATKTENLSAAEINRKKRAAYMREYRARRMPKEERIKRRKTKELKSKDSQSNKIIPNRSFATEKLSESTKEFVDEENFYNNHENTENAMETYSFETAEPPHSSPIQQFSLGVMRSSTPKKSKISPQSAEKEIQFKQQQRAAYMRDYRARRKLQSIDPLSDIKQFQIRKRKTTAINSKNLGVGVNFDTEKTTIIRANETIMS